MSASDPSPIATALVTGGGGFVGRAVIRRLLDRGVSVRCLARGDYPDLASSGVAMVRGDIADMQAVSRAVSGCDTVFHVAAKAGVWGDYDSYHRPNVVGTHNIIAACRGRGVRRFVYTSSPSVVFDGSNMRGVNESVPYPRRHKSNYSATKAIAEQAVLAANDDTLCTVALRPHLVWGPGDNHIVPRILAQARSGKLRRIGAGDPRVDTTYIDNAADAHINAAYALIDNPNAAGRAYFISQGQPIGIWTIIDGILDAGGLPLLERKVPRWVAMSAATVLENVYRTLRIKSEPRLTRFVVREMTSEHWFDISAAKRDLGYEPAVSIDEGLRRLRASLSGP